MAEVKVNGKEDEMGMENNDKIEGLLSKDPFNLEVWSGMIRHAQSLNIKDARKIYERVVENFPTSGKFWKFYVDHEIKEEQYDVVEKLFPRCLENTLNVDLWKTYTNYVKVTKAKSPTFREKMAHAYDFTLEKMGLHNQSYVFWVDYINFLKAVDASGSYAENQRISAVRKIYQRGVMTPILNIETLWREYCSFEMGINPLIGKKMQEDRCRDYATAKKVSKEYQNVIKSLNLNMTCLPPGSNPQQKKQKILWKEYIAWEKSNPMNTDDVTLVIRRVMFAYDQCMLCLGKHVDIWIEAGKFLQEMSTDLAAKGDSAGSKLFNDKVKQLYEKAINGWLKNSPLIYYIYAEFAEVRNNTDLVHRVYKKLIAIKHIDPTLTFIHYMNYTRRAEGVKSFRTVFKMAREDTRCTYHIYVASAAIEHFGRKDSSVAFKIYELGMKKHHNKEAFLLEYINYMTDVNEDNNTRVLYERILSLEKLKVENTFNIWDNFMRFEMQVGDISSITKVEKRRATVLSKEADKSDDYCALLIDRFCYKELSPCVPVELACIYHKNSSSMNNRSINRQPLVTGQTSRVSNCSTSSSYLSQRKTGIEIEGFVRPNFEQMKPYLPRITAIPGQHIIDGGIFPPPVAVAELISILPPPNQFEGPFVMVDKLMDLLDSLDLESVNYTSMPGNSVLDQGTLNSIEIAIGRKRRVTSAVGDKQDDSDLEEDAPPTNDLFRSRQQKKTKLQL